MTKGLLKDVEAIIILKYKMGNNTFNLLYNFNISCYVKIFWE